MFVKAKTRALYFLYISCRFKEFMQMILGILFVGMRGSLKGGTISLVLVFDTANIRKLFYLFIYLFSQKCDSIGSVQHSFTLLCFVLFYFIVLFTKSYKISVIVYYTGMYGLYAHSIFRYIYLQVMIVMLHTTLE